MLLSCTLSSIRVNKVQKLIRMFVYLYAVKPSLFNVLRLSQVTGLIVLCTQGTLDGTPALLAYVHQAKYGVAAIVYCQRPIKTAILRRCLSGFGDVRQCWPNVCIELMLVRSLPKYRLTHTHRPYRPRTGALSSNISCFVCYNGTGVFGVSHLEVLFSFDKAIALFFGQLCSGVVAVGYQR